MNNNITILPIGGTVSARATVTERDQTFRQTILLPYLTHKMLLHLLILSYTEGGGVRDDGQVNTYLPSTLTKYASFT